MTLLEKLKEPNQVFSLTLLLPSALIIRLQFLASAYAESSINKHACAHTAQICRICQNVCGDRDLQQRKTQKLYRKRARYKAVGNPILHFFNENYCITVCCTIFYILHSAENSQYQNIYSLQHQHSIECFTCNVSRTVKFL